jgi:hypothetical protein
MALTRIQIVNLALDQAGLDTSFQAKARNWLNYITKNLSERQNYKFYRKSVDAPFVVNQTDYDLGSIAPDFDRVDGMFYVDSNGVQGRGIFLADAYMFDQYRTNGSGFPYYAYIDEEDNTVKFNSSPASVAGDAFRMFYFREPATLSLDDADDGVIPDYKDQGTLVAELEAMAFKFIDDERYGQQKQEAKQESQTYQRLTSQVDGNSKMDLNSWQFRSNRRRYARSGRF